MTDKEKAIVMAHTGICMLIEDKFYIFHKYVEELMGRPILTHEIGWLADAIKEKSKVDFMALCADESSGQKPKWIPVSERLPMMGDTFLVTIEYKGEVIGVDAASYSPVEGYIDKHWDTFNDWKEDDDSCYHVTAWMPLPEPYAPNN